MTIKIATITDTCGDETTVFVDATTIRVEVRDQTLVAHFAEDTEDSAAYATGAYTIGMAQSLVYALQDAIHAARREAESSYTMVDGDGYLWAYLSGHWHCVLLTTDPEDHFFLNGTKSAYPGFEAWERVAANHGFQEV